MVTKNDILEFNPKIEKQKFRNQSYKNLKLNLNDLIIFKKQKEYNFRKEDDKMCILVEDDLKAYVLYIHLFVLRHYKLNIFLHL